MSKTDYPNASIDRELKVAYARLTDKPVARTEHPADYLNVDVASDGTIVGVELLALTLPIKAAADKPRLAVDTTKADEQLARLLADPDAYFAEAWKRANAEIRAEREAERRKPRRRRGAK